MDQCKPKPNKRLLKLMVLCRDVKFVNIPPNTEIYNSQYILQVICGGTGVFISLGTFSPGPIPATKNHQTAANVFHHNHAIVVLCTAKISIHHLCASSGSYATCML